MRYYDQLLSKQDEKNKGWHDSPDLHHLYASSLHQTHLLSNPTIPPQIPHFQHLPEDQSLCFLMLEDQADPSSSSTMTQLLHLQKHHHHQHHRQENEKVHLSINHNQQVVMCDAWQWACRIWNLQSRKGVMLQSCYLIIIWTTFSLQCNFVCFLHHFSLSLRIAPSMHSWYHDL